MRLFRPLVAVLLLCAPWSFAAANNTDDGFIWIDANTRIKVKPVATAGGGATAPEKTPKKQEKKETPKK